MAELTPEQIASIENVIAELKEHQTQLQQIITDVEFEKDRTRKLEGVLTRLLPPTNRLDHLFK